MALFAIWLFSDITADLSWSEAGLLAHDHHPIAIAGIAVGIIFAIYEAGQIVLEHSRGEPYRTFLLFGFASFGICTVVSMFTHGGTEWSDSMQFTNDIVLSLPVLFLWITVVKHETGRDIG